MKTFKDYFTENHKTYQFRIKIADCEVNSEFMTCLENALQAYELHDITAPKRFPYSESPDFGGLGIVEVHSFDITLGYPTIDAQIRQLINERTCVPLSHIVVNPTNSPEEEWREQAEKRANETYEPLLTTPYADSKQEPVYGDARNEKLLKDLGSRKTDFAKDSKEKGKTTNELPQGTTSPVGTHKNKISRPVKGNK